MVFQMLVEAQWITRVPIVEIELAAAQNNVEVVFIAKVCLTIIPLGLNESTHCN